MPSPEKRNMRPTRRTFKELKKFRKEFGDNDLGGKVDSTVGLNNEKGFYAPDHERWHLDDERLVYETGVSESVSGTAEHFYVPITSLREVLDSNQFKTKGGTVGRRYPLRRNSGENNRQKRRLERVATGILQANFPNEDFESADDTYLDPVVDNAQVSPLALDTRTVSTMYQGAVIENQYSDYGVNDKVEKPVDTVASGYSTSAFGAFLSPEQRAKLIEGSEAEENEGLSIFPEEFDYAVNPAVIRFYESAYQIPRDQILSGNFDIELDVAILDSLRNLLKSGKVPWPFTESEHFTLLDSEYGIQKYPSEWTQKVRENGELALRFVDMAAPILDRKDAYQSLDYSESLIGQLYDLGQKIDFSYFTEEDERLRKRIGFICAFVESYYEYIIPVQQFVANHPNQFHDTWKDLIEEISDLPLGELCGRYWPLVDKFKDRATSRTEKPALAEAMVIYDSLIRERKKDEGQKVRHNRRGDKRRSVENLDQTDNSGIDVGELIIGDYADYYEAFSGRSFNELKKERIYLLARIENAGKASSKEDAQRLSIIHYILSTRDQEKKTATHFLRQRGIEVRNHPKIFYVNRSGIVKTGYLRRVSGAEGLVQIVENSDVDLYGTSEGYYARPSVVFLTEKEASEFAGQQVSLRKKDQNKPKKSITGSPRSDGPVRPPVPKESPPQKIHDPKAASSVTNSSVQPATNIAVTSPEPVPASDSVEPGVDLEDWEYTAIFEGVLDRFSGDPSDYMSESELAHIQIARHDIDQDFLDQLWAEFQNSVDLDDDSQDEIAIKLGLYEGRIRFPDIADSQVVEQSKPDKPAGKGELPKQEKDLNPHNEPVDSLGSKEAVLTKDDLNKILERVSDMPYPNLVQRLSKDLYAEIIEIHTMVSRRKDLNNFYKEFKGRTINTLINADKLLPRKYRSDKEGGYRWDIGMKQFGRKLLRYVYTQEIKSRTNSPDAEIVNNERESQGKKLTSPTDVMDLLYQDRADQVLLDFNWELAQVVNGDRRAALQQKYIELSYQVMAAWNSQSDGYQNAKDRLQKLLQSSKSDLENYTLMNKA